MIGHEVLGSGAGVEIHGPVLAKFLPIRVGDEVKIVWRMTDSGPFTTTAMSPSGGRIKPAGQSLFAT